MTAVTRFSTAAIPMAGFEEQAQGQEDIVVYLDNFAKKYFGAKYGRRATVPAPTTHLIGEVFYPGSSVLRKVPQSAAIELFRLPGDPDQLAPFAAERRFEEAASEYVAVLYSLFVHFTLEARNAILHGDATRSFESLLASHHGSTKCPKAAFFEQRMGRVNRVVTVHHPAVGRDSQPTDPWQRWFTKLNSLLALTEGWNGDDSNPPNELAVYNASVFLKALRRENCEPTRIAASAMSGVAVTRKVGNRKVLLECYNDGRVYFLFSNRESGSMDVKPLSLDRDSLTAFIASMREFLHG
jgi:hypothetical protein